MKFSLIALLASIQAQEVFLGKEEFTPLIDKRYPFMEDKHCVAPGVCTPPKTKYQNRAMLVPRDQWTISGGFCGSLSI